MDNHSDISITSLHFLTCMLITISCLPTLTVGAVPVPVTNDTSYENVKALTDSLFSTQQYSTFLPPIRNQSEPIVITGYFTLLTIVSLDDVKQKLTTSGFVALFWDDELRSWGNQESLESIERLHVDVKDVWRPHMQIMNAFEDSDPFADKNSYMAINYRGRTMWMPFGFFHTYCKLNLWKFPFDIQDCNIEMCPIKHDQSAVLLQMDEYMHMAYFFPNSGWDLIHSYVVNKNKTFSGDHGFSCSVFHFKLKRRHTVIVLDLILPAMSLSFMNNLAFLIPVESGQNIGYAITVLLSLTVFLSAVSSMTPRVTDVIPAVNIYLFVLLLTSVTTVAAIIFTEYLHNLDNNVKDAETPNQSHTDPQNSPPIQTTFSPCYTVDTSGSKNDDNQIEYSNGQNKNTLYSHLARRINLAFFVIVMVVYSITTIWYFTSTSTIGSL